MGINNTFQQRVDMKQLKRKLLIQHIVRGIEIFVLSNSFEGGLLSWLIYKSFYVYTCIRVCSTCCVHTSKAWRANRLIQVERKIQMHSFNGFHYKLGIIMKRSIMST